MQEQTMVTCIGDGAEDAAGARSPALVQVTIVPEAPGGGDLSEARKAREPAPLQAKLSLSVTTTFRRSLT